MLPSEDTGYGTTGSIMRATRAASRRELINSKRTRQTDLLPDLEEEVSTGKATGRQSEALREENNHLQRDLAALQEMLEESRTTLEQLEGEIETIHHAHQQEIEQYQQHLREMMDERNQMQEANQQMEHRYQELYQTFQDAVEDEANKMVQEAAQTMVLSPERTPALLNDVVNTLEAQLKQTEDQRTAELLAVMRQAQYKSELLEQEVAHERNELAIERDSLRVQREGISQQAKARYKTESARLRVRWTAALTFVSIVLFALMVVLELLFYSLHAPLYIVLFVPLIICMALSYVFAHLHTIGRINIQFKAAPQPKTPAKTPAKAPEKAVSK